MTRPGIPLAASLALACLVTACSSPLSPEKARGVAPAEEGAPRLIALPAGIVLDDDNSDYSFSVVLTGPSGPLAAVDITAQVYAGTPWLSGALPLGDWSAAVDAFDADGTALAGGSASTTALGPETRDAAIDLSLPSGNGGLVAGISWTPADCPWLLATDISLSLEPRPSGAAIDLTAAGYSSDLVAGTAGYSGSIAAGSYLLRASIVHGGRTMWGTARSVMIQAGMTTSPATIVASNGSINDPPVLTVSKAGGVYVTGERVTLSASAGATVLYSLDGSVPSLPYPGGAISLSGDLTLRASASSRFGSAAGSWAFAESPAIFVDAAWAGVEKGDSTAPFNTLGEALALARTLNYSGTLAIRLAGGTYEEASGAVLDRSVSIAGGYDGSDWSGAPDPALHPTTVSRSASTGAGTASDPIATMSITAASVAIKDISITSALAPGAADYSAALLVKAGDAAISNCAISGGSATVESYAVSGFGPGLSIAGGTLSGGSGASLSAALRMSGGSATISSCQAGGGSGQSSLGILASGSSLDLRSSTIDGGAGVTAAYGVSLSGCAAYLEGNLVRASSPGAIALRVMEPGQVTLARNRVAAEGAGAVGMLLGSASAAADEVLIVSNAVAAFGAGGSALRFESSFAGPSSPQIVGNDFYADQGSGIVVAPASGAATSATFRNNLAFGLGAAGIGYEEAPSGGGNPDAWLLSNNLFFGAVAAYRDSVEGDLSALADLNTRSKTAQTGTYVVENLAGDPSSYFVSAPPAGLASFPAADWRLSAAGLAALQGAGAATADGFADLYGQARASPRCSTGASEQ